jgi:hypothetical protein
MMARYLLSATVLLTGISIGHCQEPTDANHWKIPNGRHDFHVFLLMGQSNMSGFGKLLPEDRKPVDRVVKLPTKHQGELKWLPAAHPLHNRLRSDRFGLGLPFAIEYLKDKPDVVVGLIPLAWGGAPIDMLKKGTPTYDDALVKTKLALKHGELKGVLWHQGESDTVSDARTSSYEQKLHQLIADLRKDLADDQLPFVAGNLAEFYGTSRDHSSPERVKRIDKVRAILRALPNRVENTGFVESKGCSSPDRHMVHFDRESYILLGQRYAKVFSEMMDRAKEGGKVRGR